ncbi:hypothetical protein WN943_026849 [Citrus x changshan-huyou]
MDQDPIYSKWEKPLDPIVRSKIDRVIGEHLMQAARVSRRQLKLLDIGDTVTGIAEQDGKLNTRAEQQKERSEEEVDNGPVVSQVKPKHRKWKLQAREMSNNSGNKNKLGASKRPGEKISWRSPNPVAILMLKHKLNKGNGLGVPGFKDI